MPHPFAGGQLPQAVQTVVDQSVLGPASTVRANRIGTSLKGPRDAAPLTTIRAYDASYGYDPDQRLRWSKYADEDPHYTAIRRRINMEHIPAAADALAAALRGVVEGGHITPQQLRTAVLPPQQAVDVPDVADDAMPDPEAFATFIRRCLFIRINQKTVAADRAGHDPAAGGVERSYVSVDGVAVEEMYDSYLGRHAPTLSLSNDAYILRDTTFLREAAADMWRDAVGAIAVHGNAPNGGGGGGDDQHRGGGDGAGNGSGDGGERRGVDGDTGDGSGDDGGRGGDTRPRGESGAERQPARNDHEDDDSSREDVRRSKRVRQPTERAEESRQQGGKGWLDWIWKGR